MFFFNNIMNIIQRQADDFFQKNNFNNSSDYFIDEVSKKLRRHQSEINKIIFLERLFILFKINYDRHQKYCTVSACNNCRFTVFYEITLFFIQNEIDLYERKISSKYLKRNERISINLKLDKFIRNLDENTFNNPINYQIFKNEIDDMRHYYYLNKKKWRQLFIGTITELENKKIISALNGKVLIAEIDSIYYLKKRDYLYPVNAKLTM